MIHLLLAAAVLIEGGTVHTMGAKGTLEKGSVWIEGSVIQQVGTSLGTPKEAQKIDASGKVVTPGLMAGYTHLGIVEISSIASTNDATSHHGRYSASFDVLYSMNPASTLIPITRIEGVTRALVAPEFGPSWIAGKGAVIQLGDRGELVVKKDTAMFVDIGERGARLTGGSRSLTFLRLKEALEDAGDFTRNRKAYESRQKRDYALSRLDLEALAPVLTGQIPIAAVAEKSTDIENLLSLRKIEPRLKMIVIGGSEAWKVADKLAEANVPVVLDPLSNSPEGFDRLSATLENPARLSRASVRFAFSTNWETHNARKIRQGAGNAVSNGLPWLEGLKGLTIFPATIWGINKNYGSIEPGKDADLVVWSGDPLEVTSYAEKVFIRGVEIKMVSRQTLLRDRYR